MRTGRMTDRAYLAATIDCEGSISLRESGHGRELSGSRGGQGKRWVLTLEVTNRSEDLILWLHENYGGKTYYRQREGNRSEVWVWQVNGRHCEIPLEASLPFLKVKQDLAILALEFISTIENAPAALSDETIVQREEITDLMKERNRRGRIAS